MALLNVECWLRCSALSLPATPAKSRQPTAAAAAASSIDQLQTSLQHASPNNRPSLCNVAAIFLINTAAAAAAESSLKSGSYLHLNNDWPWMTSTEISYWWIFSRQGRSHLVNNNIFSAQKTSKMTSTRCIEATNMVSKYYDEATRF